MRREAGLTLIEVVTAMALALVLIGAGLPQLQAYAAKGRVEAGGSRLAGDLAYARTEAVSRGGRVSVAPQGGDWGRGWQVTDRRGQVLRVAGPLAGQVRISADASALTFRATGALAGATGVTFQLCGNDAGQQVAVAPIGRLSTATAPCNEEV